MGWGGVGGGGVGMETHLSTIIIDPTCISRRGDLNWFRYVVCTCTRREVVEGNNLFCDILAQHVERMCIIFNWSGWCYRWCKAKTYVNLFKKMHTLRVRNGLILYLKFNCAGILLIKARSNIYLKTTSFELWGKVSSSTKQHRSRKGWSGNNWSLSPAFR